MSNWSDRNRGQEKSLSIDGSINMIVTVSNNVNHNLDNTFDEDVILRSLSHEEHSDIYRASSTNLVELFVNNI